MHWIQAFLLMLGIGALVIGAPVAGITLGWIAGIGGGIMILAALFKMWKEENQNDT
jgi:anaerobic C4-dicarboxylate transporter